MQRSAHSAPKALAWNLTSRGFGWLLAATCVVSLVVSGAGTLVMVAMATPSGGKADEFTGLLGLYVAVTGLLAMVGAVGMWVGLGRRADHDGFTWLWLLWWAAAQVAAALLWMWGSFSDPKILGARATLVPILAVACCVMAALARRHCVARR